ncbi:PREDICTED: F-box protein At5g52880 [Ipomoea nil]|uniref:F-box protein At5g52880 n=1 Tax=Ipomoea nil TaxID=35883 RepID=UPI000901FDC1|nr:PREDICTED: F-box protein At5g52880 [Ipomoea nil]
MEELSQTSRYRWLGLRDALNRHYHYSIVCNELSLILRNAYSRLSKNLQSLIFDDILLAFRLLPEMQTQASISAANALVQSVEATLPKQKRCIATKEFKHAIIAHKRRAKANCEEQGPIHLPQDVIAHMFQFLDIQTLLVAALVCRSWSQAASDNHLWQLIYTNFFGTSPLNSSNDVECSRCTSAQNVQDICREETSTSTSVDWKNAFKRAYKDMSSKLVLTSQRGYCSYCCSVVWLDNGKCSNEHTSHGGKNHSVKPLSVEQIVDYITSNTLPGSYSSDSDLEDSDYESLFKLWAYPKRIAKS